jgi:hypothetical protein
VATGPNKSGDALLTLREACNKIIHERDIKDDPVIPYPNSNPDEMSSYI